ncbi:MAG: 50S ribosome-binding GTPase, partial [Candidatus Koribacter versatilis]|nr:50S ribosome-binding GTPase [Candidatus Koribacter versatilis]
MRIISRFLLAATDQRHFPAPSLPEIAFLGRSNVGKSSVINALVGTKLARTSNTPGRTRSI